jgi:hypothetical protein
LASIYVGAKAPTPYAENIFPQPDFTPLLGGINPPLQGGNGNAQDHR